MLFSLSVAKTKASCFECWFAQASDVALCVQREKEQCRLFPARVFGRSTEDRARATKKKRSRVFFSLPLSSWHNSDALKKKRRKKTENLCFFSLFLSALSPNRIEMSAAAALAARSPCAASVSPRVEQQLQQQQQQQQQQRRLAGRRRGGMVVSALSCSSSSSSPRFSSPRGLNNALVGSAVPRSTLAHTNSNVNRLGNVSAAAAAEASSDQTAGKPSSSSSASTTTTAAAPSLPSIPQDTIPATPATANEWELDFGSRPVLDERGKKWWELLIVAKSGSGGGDGDGESQEAPWVYSRWLPNTKINSAQVSSGFATTRESDKRETEDANCRPTNKEAFAKNSVGNSFSPSTSLFFLSLFSHHSSHPYPFSIPPPKKKKKKQLKAAIAEIASQPGASSPSSVRFFRGAMQNIITRALTESGIKPVPSRRCFALFAELERRAAEVYPRTPGFSATAPPPFGALDAFGGGAGGGGAPAQLPDALRGEAWAFVQLPLEELAPELDAVRRGDVFGAVFDVDRAKDKALPPAGTPIPGMNKRKRERREGFEETGREARDNERKRITETHTQPRF